MDGEKVNTFDYEKEAHMLEEASAIQWSSVIFAPFHPVFRFLVLISVIIKSFLGPLQAVYPIVYCSDTMDMHPILSFIKYYYWYCCDTIYGADTFLHIVHRQVVDEAMRREHLPKSAFWIIIDLISLVPFFKLVGNEDCPNPKVWPNILAFSESLVLYRVVEYFALVTTHSLWKMSVGFTVMVITCLNCVNCFWLLLTYQGLCKICETGIYDWRSIIQFKLNETDINYTTYFYGYTYIYGFLNNRSYDEIKPHTIMEFEMICLFIVSGYLVTLFILLPKCFSEGILRLRAICRSYPYVKKYTEETQRRNTGYAGEQVKNFYVLMWKKRSGITSMSEGMTSLPRYMRVEIRQDLVWQLYYHSPTLRKTSNPFKRWLCEYIKLEYKLPGEKFYAGPQCQTNLYYIKSGVVQIISTEDGTTPILSLTGGTVLGDVNFLVPPTKRKIQMRCLTYCEVIYVDRKYLLRAISKYSKDREVIMKRTKERLEHARSLYACKQQIRGLDRAEGQGISWIIKRWWEISALMLNHTKVARKSNYNIQCVIPPEETTYHCPKYIGQLVLSTEEQKQTKSMFVNDKFPWILTPDSLFVDVWHRIVFATVFIVNIAYPPNLTGPELPKWFECLQWWTNFIYAADICISLLICLPGQEQDTVSFTTVMFARFKSYKFILDVLSAIWTENIVLIIGLPDYYYVVQFNRLLKTYVILFGFYLRMDIRRRPIVNINYKTMLRVFFYFYFTSYVIYEIDRRYHQLTTAYFFGARYCSDVKITARCDPGGDSVFGVFFAWVVEMVFLENYPLHLVDIYLAIIIDYFSYLMYTFCKMKIVVCLYLKFKDIVEYQTFVSSLEKYYVYQKIHPDLLKRLERYLVCHWKYYKGQDVMHPNVIVKEPHNVYWKAQGQVAEKIIGGCKAFIGANPLLIRELAHAAQLMILPSCSSIFTFGAQCKNVTWIVQGCIKCEYHDEKGQILKVYYGSGQMLGVGSVFFGKSSRTYTSDTDCEILYIRIKDFFNIIKRYTTDWTYYENCMNELRPEFEKMFYANVLKHRDYQHELRNRLYSARMSTMIAPGTRLVSDMIEYEYRSSPFEGIFWGEPNSVFMQKWLCFRAIAVVVNIICSSFQGTIGSHIRWQLNMISFFCDGVAYMDIILKLFLGYYNEQGLLITDKRLCLMHYLTRGFVPDVIGAAPIKQIVRAALVEGIDDDYGLLFTTICKFAHLYILCEYFNYVSDTPLVNKSLIMIVKWQVLNLMLMIGASHYLVVHCIDFTFDSRWKIVNMERLNICWMPKFMKVDDPLTYDQMHLIFIESFNLVQSGFMTTNIGRFSINNDQMTLGCFLIVLGIFWWYVSCYTLALLVLGTRGDTLFKHAVNQLKSFLEGERVEKSLIKRAVQYFRYTWIRTKGVNIHPLTRERIGVVFRQDLSFYFYRKTFMALDTILGGGEAMVRQLASASTQIYFMPEQEILREMDLSKVVFIVHRGKVIITKGGDRVINLAKGCIFGQLKGRQTRPIKVTVTADGYVDLLQIPIKQFQEIINDQVRKNIANSPQSKYDFMAARKIFPENPYDTIQYILRGRKTIQLPWMRRPTEAHSNTWYNRWLFIAWFIEPFISSIVVLLFGTLPLDYVHQIYPFLGALDAIHFLHFLSEFFTITVDVVDNKCESRVIGTRHFKFWGLYVDAVSLITPFITFFHDIRAWHLGRLLRLRLLYNFHIHYCRSFKSNAAEILLKIMILVLLVHGFSCGWIYVACRNEEFPIMIPKISDAVNSTIDYNEWVQPNMRHGGCARMAATFTENGHRIQTFLVAKNWRNDYIVALSYVLMIYRHLPLESVVCLSINENYYKVIMTFILYMIDIWVISIAINTMYAKLREVYYYDYTLINLIKYLQHNGLSPVLMEAVRTYSKQLWTRQKGNWLPELVNRAPDCLRQDLFDSLYMYHLDVPATYRNIPTYFKRQMAARMKRVVLFPGKCIVREGDIYACTYFIHEGEVEKWFIDTEGDNKLQSLIYTNGYFEILPGLNYIPYQFSYYTRTVVDLVYLRLSDWQDLLDSYPDVKRELDIAAREFRTHLVKQRFGKTMSGQGTGKSEPFYAPKPNITEQRFSSSTSI